MNKTDDYIKDFAEMLADVFGADVKIIKLDISKLANKLRAKNFKEMIADTEKNLNEINDNPNMNIQEKIKSLAVIALNASVVDAEDMNALTKEEAEDYFNFIKDACIKFNNILYSIQNNINYLKDEMAHPKEEDEDLTKLTKEELIARLREKSK